jgi:DNA-directed RNA polymerase II subunit RPB2
VELLPHISTAPHSESRKAYFVGYMVHRMCLGSLGRLGEDDRDHFGKKRMDMAGPLMAGSFGTLFRKMAKDCRRQLQRFIDHGKPFDVAAAIRAVSSITHGMNYQLATGNWAKDKLGQVIRTGVSQVLNRLTFASNSSHLRRLNTPIGREGKLAKPRQLHNTHWGFVCPAETPEGHQVGLVKNLSLMCYVTVGCSSEMLMDTLLELGLIQLEEISPSQINEGTKVFVNGNWCGLHLDPQELYNALKKMKRNGDISIETSIVRDIENQVGLQFFI